MAEDAFIQFKNSKGTAVVGESTDDKHKTWSDILSWSTSGSHAQTLGSASGGAGAGKVSLGDFSFSKYLDSATDDLLQNMYAGEHFAEVNVECRIAGGVDAANTPQKPYLYINMKEVFVTGYSVGWGGDRPTESWSLTCGKFGFSYKPQDEKGAVGNVQPIGWDQTVNKPWAPPKPA
jgi:type VI secretion system secreted protein Hcp